MPIILQPAFDALPAYRPVKFELVQSWLNPEVVEKSYPNFFEELEKAYLSESNGEKK